MTAGNKPSQHAPFTTRTGVAKPRTVARQLAMVFVVWLLLVGLFIGATIRDGLQQATGELESTGLTMHRVVSQLTAQHDAHLTSLIALITSTTPPPEAATVQVAQSILKFYPRIVGIDIVKLPYTGAAASTLISVRNAQPVVDYRWIADAVMQQKAGRVHAYLRPDMPDVYFLAKRATNAPEGLAVIMRIDAQQLLQTQAPVTSTNIRLLLNGQTIVQQLAKAHHTQTLILGHPRFNRMIDNQSQSFVLEADKPIYLRDVLDPVKIAVFAALALLLLLVLRFAWQQRNRAKALQLSAQKAEQRAQLLEHETRLAHASRVNALGEMASGIAHELTQPLTALLSQSQAAVRIATQALPDQQLLAQALAANVREAKRAGEMLKRMRDYMSNTPPKPMLSDLNAIVQDVAALTRSDLERKGIALQLILDAASPVAVVDVIEMEQVLHNLVRNAADAMQGHVLPTQAITVQTRVNASSIVITVSDTGPGIADEVFPRLFEPFFTTKASGMGLGLSLCATLVERVGGSIQGHNHSKRGAVFTITLPVPQQSEVM